MTPMEEPLKYFLERTTPFGLLARWHRQKKLEKNFLEWKKQGGSGPMPSYGKQQVVLEYIKKFSPDVFIETGTYKGKMVYAVMPYVRPIYSIELDTKHFDQRFKDRLLATYDNLDEVTDGLLVHSENFQALNLLRNKYHDEVKCIYIDPPYNTSENTFLYKNDYKHSSWITMIKNRLETAYGLLLTDGVLLSAIDDTEKQHLRIVMQNLFGIENYVTTIAAEVNPAGQNLRPNSPALSHDVGIVQFYKPSA